MASGELTWPPEKNSSYSREKAFNWGSTGPGGGWIATTSLAGQVVSVKASGDSLRQLTFGIPHYYPKWSPDGQKLICELNGPRPQQFGLVLLSKTGQQLGPILARPYGYAQAWSPDGQKLALVYNPSNDVYGLGEYDFATSQLRLVKSSRQSTSSAGNIYRASWLPHGHLGFRAGGIQNGHADRTNRAITQGLRKSYLLVSQRFAGRQAADCGAD